MNQQDHIIHSILYEVQFDDGINMDGQNILHKLHQDHANNVFQEVFDQAAANEEYILIKTCELDLGVIPMTDWQTCFVERLGKLLKEKLGETILTALVQKKGLYHVNPIGELPVISIMSKEEQEVALFLFFLKRGYLKWNVLRPSGISINQLFERITARHSEDFRHQVFILFKRSENALERFLVQIKSRHILYWLSGFAPWAADTYHDIDLLTAGEFNEYTTVSASFFKTFVLWLKKRLIYYLILNEGKVLNVEGLLNESAADIYSHLKIDQQVSRIKKDTQAQNKPVNPILKRIIDLISLSNKEVEKGREVLTEGNTRTEKNAGEVKEIAENQHQTPSQNIETDNQENTQKENIIIRNVKDPKIYSQQKQSDKDHQKDKSKGESGQVKDIEEGKDKSTIKKNNTVAFDEELRAEIQSLTSEVEIKDLVNEELTEGILATHAGLILLWPYLNSLFDKLGLLKAEKFKSKRTWNKSLFVLHYLATGRVYAEEHELLIPKILTAYPLEWVAPTNQFLGKGVINECTNLLNSAIKNWSALKSTSPGGLRQTFLQREALVKKQEDEWKFMFERKGVDVLIDNLPFGLSFIKFKWLNTFIQVIW